MPKTINMILGDKKNRQLYREMKGRAKEREKNTPLIWDSNIYVRSMTMNRLIIIKTNVIKHQYYLIYNFMQI